MKLPAVVEEAIRCGPVPKLRSEKQIRDTPQTKGERVIAWAERFLKIPEGPKTGEPMRLDIYQKAFIIAVFDNPAETNKAYLSVARRNGKTFVISVILLAYICGPAAEQNISLCSAANSREQSALAFDLMVMMLDMSEKLESGVHYKYTASSKSITGLRKNVRYRAISAEAKTGHGKAYKVILLDEAGQIVQESNDFTSMLETSMSNYDDALFFIVSTQAPADSAYFSQQLDLAEVHQDPHTVSHVYCAREVDKDTPVDLQDRDQWYRANPGLGKFRSLKSMQQSANEAEMLPAKANGIMNLNYNMRVSTLALMISPQAWKKNLRPINMETRSKTPIDIGLDLALKNDLCCASAAWRDDNADINIQTLSFTPALGIKQRELRDKVPYEQMVKDGNLIAIPGPTIDYEIVCRHLAKELKGCDIRSVQFDRYRIDQFKEAAKKTDFYGMVGEWVEVGQGFVSMGVRVDALEQEVLQGRLRTGSAPTLNLAVSTAVVGQDEVMNRKPLKTKSIHKIDALVAALMSVFPNSDGQVASRPFDVDALVG